MSLGFMDKFRQGRGRGLEIRKKRNAFFMDSPSNAYLYFLNNSTVLREAKILL